MADDNTNLFFVPLLTRVDPLGPGTATGVAFGLCCVKRETNSSKMCAWRSRTLINSNGHAGVSIYWHVWMSNMYKKRVDDTKTLIWGLKISRLLIVQHVWKQKNRSDLELEYGSLRFRAFTSLKAEISFEWHNCSGLQKRRKRNCCRLRWQCLCRSS